MRVVLIAFVAVAIAAVVWLTRSPQSSEMPVHAERSAKESAAATKRLVPPPEVTLPAASAPVAAPNAPGNPSTGEAPLSNADAGLLAMGRADELLRNGEPQKALQALRDVMKSRGESAQLHASMGAVYAQLGNSAAAVQSFKRALDMEPSNERALQDLVEIATQNKGAAAAQGVQALREVAQKNGNDPIPQIALADYYQRKNDPVQAAAVLENAARIPNAPDGINGRLADAYFRSNQPEKMRERLSATTQREEDRFRSNPSPENARRLDDARIDEIYGVIRTQDAREYKKAEAALTQYAQTYPDNEPVQRMLTDLRARLEGRPEGNAPTR